MSGRRESLVLRDKKVKYLHHHIRLNLECQKDILWWIKYLTDWNGKSVFL